MRVQKFFGLVSLASLVALATSCATTFAEPTEKIKIDSEPQGATVKYGGVKYGQTPIDLYIDAAKTQSIKLLKDGYEVATVELSRKIGPGWIAADVMTLLIGLPVDAYTGAWYSYEQTEFMVKLQKKGSESKEDSGEEAVADKETEPEETETTDEAATDEKTADKSSTDGESKDEKSKDEESEQATAQADEPESDASGDDRERVEIDTEGMSARDLYKRGAKAYKNEDYRRALANFEAAHEKSPDAILLYNIAFSQTKLGRHGAALETIDRIDNRDQLPDKVRSKLQSIEAANLIIQKTGGMAENPNS